MVDFACIISATLFLIANTLDVIYTIQRHNPFHFSPNSFRSLNAEYIEKEWQTRLDHAPMMNTMSFFKSLAWFSLCIPVVQIAWIMSNAGKRRVALHTVIMALVLGGSCTELVARLMITGTHGVGYWIADEFELENWLTSSSDDDVGWKTLEVVHLLNHGLMMWIDTFEWFTLSMILIHIYLSVWYDTQTEYAFGKKWAATGLFIGILSFFVFVANILRHNRVKPTRQIEHALAIITTAVFLPIWLFVLAFQMQPVRDHFESRRGKKKMENGAEDDDDDGGREMEGHYPGEY